MANEGRIKAESIRRWLNSDEGKDMCAGMAQGQYLENRLWRAYMAGWDDGANSQRSEAPALVEKKNAKRGN